MPFQVRLHSVVRARPRSAAIVAALADTAVGFDCVAVLSSPSRKTRLLPYPFRGRKDSGFPDMYEIPASLSQRESRLGL